MVFADDQWSQVEQRQLMAQERAALVYSTKYTETNLNGSQATWNGLGYTSTDETTKGRDLNAQAEASAQNALAEFDKIHVRQLVSLQNTGYQGLNSTATDEQGRDRNALVAQAEAQSLNGSEAIVSELARINATYTNLQDQGTTNEQAPDRQAQLQKTWDDMETQATALVNAISKIDTDYVNLQSGPTTNENTVGRQLDSAQAYALSKAITIFQEIHAKHLAYTQSTDYAGLNSSTTNENVYQSRNSEIEDASQMALQNAINTYNSYYNGAGLNQTLYSH